jgi:uncharacterized protein (DUF433 family)
MAPTSNEKVAIVRKERGLTISGTRITLYDIMDYLKAQYPSKFIGSLFELTDEQIEDVEEQQETGQYLIHALDND